MNYNERLTHLCDSWLDILSGNLRDHKPKMRGDSTSATKISRQLSDRTPPTQRRSLSQLIKKLSLDQRF